MGLADVLGLVSFLALIAGFVVALILSVAPRVPRWLTVALAAALALQALDLVVLARQRDPYFDPDHVTYWEFAARDDREPIVVVAIAAALATSAGLVVAIVSANRRLRRVSAGFGAIAFVSVLLGGFALTVGH
jgi:uncharacterized membrane protein